MRSIRTRTGAGFVVVLLMAFCALSQQPTSTGKKINSGYVLGPDDQIAIRAVDSPEISGKPFLIGLDGKITIPLIGRVEAAGLTIEQLETTLNTQLKKYVQDPQISVTVEDFRSQPVSIFGAVTKPGVIQLRGAKTLYEVLSMAGGPTANAGSTMTVTRRRENGEIPLPTATVDATGQFSTAQINVQEVLDGRNPAENIEVKPNDTISVSEASSNMIYVVGDVEHGGAFTLGGREEISVLRALSLAGGLGRTARPDKARIIRGSPKGERPLEIIVNVKQMLNGKTEDIGLRPQDVLVIPTSSRRVFTTYSVPSIVSAAVYGAIYHF